MIRVVISGAAGRMGRHLISNIVSSGDMTLAGATEREGSEFLGMDAGSRLRKIPGRSRSHSSSSLLKDDDAL
jgi:4-hydroxy-tetrahydrodipicolinate reductase